MVEAEENVNKGWSLAIIDYVYGKPGKRYTNVIGFIKCIHDFHIDDYQDNYYEAIIPDLDYELCYIDKRKIVRML